MWSAARHGRIGVPYPVRMPRDTETKPGVPEPPPPRRAPGPADADPPATKLPPPTTPISGPKPPPK